MTVTNDVIPSVINLMVDEASANQSQGKIELPIRRSEQLKGKVVVPWKVLPGSSDSVYTNLTGQTSFL